MRYIPKLTRKEIKENHKHCVERLSIYKKRGLDFSKNREFILEKAGPLRGRILEIGTGTGHMTLTLAMSGHIITSVDNDKEALKTAALNLAHENILSSVAFYMMDGRSLGFHDGSFENVFVVNAFHHIDGIDEMLSEIDRVLSDNGKIVLADFNKNGMKIISAVHRGEGHVHKDSGIGRDDIRSYFRILGYKIKSYKDKCNWILIGEKKQGKRREA